MIDCLTEFTKKKSCKCDKHGAFPNHGENPHMHLSVLLLVAAVVVSMSCTPDQHSHACWWVCATGMGDSSMAKRMRKGMNSQPWPGFSTSMNVMSLMSNQTTIEQHEYHDRHASTGNDDLLYLPGFSGQTCVWTFVYVCSQAQLYLGIPIQMYCAYIALLDPVKFSY